MSLWADHIKEMIFIYNDKTHWFYFRLELDLQ